MKPKSLEIITTIMDTMTYAAGAVRPWSVAQQIKHPVVPEAEFTLRESRDGHPAGERLPLALNG